MNDANKNILVWLPSPMGDAILCTPGLRAIRKRFEQSKITFLSGSVVRGVLSPCSFADGWLETDNYGVFALVKLFKKQKFTQAILFKNSFGSTLACFLGGIPARFGYTREWRGILLTDRLRPPRMPSGDFKPVSVVDYYLAVASHLGADIQDRTIELTVEPKDVETVKARMPEIFNAGGPLVIFVPGAAGPSKRWPADRFAELADRLADGYNAMIVLSIAPNAEERQIAEEIVKAASHKVINLADYSISMSELKGLYSLADLVICNDTGPRHIAIALKRKVVTLVGPNNPEWTDPAYNDEIFVKGQAPCAPCDKNICKETSRFCMESISVEMVCEAAAGVLEQKKNERRETTGEGRKALSGKTTFFIESGYKAGFEKAGLNSIETVFAFQGGNNLAKNNLAAHRSRIEFQIDNPAVTLFMKRYDRPPVSAQLKNWLAAKQRISCALGEVDAAEKLASLGVSVPKMVAWGEQWGAVFEKRSFVIIEKINDGVSLEKQLPDFFDWPATNETIEKRRWFISELAKFVKKFHDTGFRHRDLYFSHVFWAGGSRKGCFAGKFYLIDLARAFKPMLFSKRYRIKDLAQLHYSAPVEYFSKTDRLRFLRTYLDGAIDKGLARLIEKKTGRIARHDAKRRQKRDQ